MENTGLGQKMLVAGPCSAESRVQVISTAQAISAQYPNAIFRAGVWKPRTRPGSFEGIGEEALDWLLEVRALTGMKVITEAASTKQLDLCLKAGLDAIWIGARTTVNPFLVQELADALKGASIQVMVKNPIHPDISLWRGAIERMQESVKSEIIAVHRGFHTFETTEFRNHPRWQVHFEMKSYFPELKMICDISHIAGARPLLQPVAQEALDLGYDGLMIETHIHPEAALSDAQQQITPTRLHELIQNLETRLPSPIDAMSIAQLKKWRDEIDRLNDEMLVLLKERLHYSSLIGELKKEKHVSIFQPERWRTILEEMNKRGKELDINDGFIRNLFIQIHDESVRIQAEIINREEKNVS